MVNFLVYGSLRVQVPYVLPVGWGPGSIKTIRHAGGDVESTLPVCLRLPKGKRSEVVQEKQFLADWWWCVRRLGGGGGGFRFTHKGLRVGVLDFRVGDLKPWFL